jgi:8-oxo-dGTP pyrophosphatase MutT (NUDIX family)
MAMSPYIRQLRAAVGTTRILMPSVAGLVRDASAERVLLVQERDGGCWSTPGGALELDDTPANGVVREVWEETGLTVVVERLWGVYGGPEFIVRYANGDETQYISTMFECRVVSGELKPDGDEVQDARFVTLSEARDLPLSPWLTRVLPQLYVRDHAAWYENPTWHPPLLE